MNPFLKPERPRGRTARVEHDVQLEPQPACAGESVQTFFPRDGDYSEAKRICATCPVKDACLDKAMRDEAAYGTSYREGMYGGMTPRERRDLDEERRGEAAEKTKDCEHDDCFETIPLTRKWCQKHRAEADRARKQRQVIRQRERRARERIEQAA